MGFIDFCDLRLQRTLQEWIATKWLEMIGWQFSNRNCYRLSRVSWALAQISCELNSGMAYAFWKKVRNASPLRPSCPIQLFNAWCVIGRRSMQQQQQRRRRRLGFCCLRRPEINAMPVLLYYVSPWKIHPGKDNHGIDMFSLYWNIAGPISLLIIGSLSPRKVSPGGQFTGKNPPRPAAAQAGRIFTGKLSAGGRLFWEGRSYNGALAIGHGRHRRMRVWSGLMTPITTWHHISPVQCAAALLIISWPNVVVCGSAPVRCRQVINWGIRSNLWHPGKRSRYAIIHRPTCTFIHRVPKNDAIFVFFG